MIPIDYGEVTDIAPGVKLTLHNACHILGSAIVHLHIGNGKYNIAFAHDFKFANSALLDIKAASNFPRLETLVMESTYGNPKDITPSRTTIRSINGTNNQKNNRAWRKNPYSCFSCRKSTRNSISN